MEEILKQLSLSEKINAALLHRTGDLFIYIRLIETYEAGNWVAFRFVQERSGVGNQKIIDFYLEAIAWADALE